MHRSLVRPILICTLVLSVHASTFSAEEPSAAEQPQETDAKTYPLAYKFELGQVVHLYSEYQAKMSVRYKEAAEVDQNATNLWKHYKVIDVKEDGSGTLELQLDKVHQTAQFGNNPPTVFKSDDENFHPPKFRDTLKEIGKPTAQTQYTSHGKLLKVVTPEGKEKVATKNQPPEDHQGFLIPLPEEPIAVGGKWKDQFQTLVKLQNGLTRAIDMKRTYELTAVEGDLAKIDFRTVVLTPVNDGRIRGQLIQRLTAGTMTLDIKRGLIVEKLVTVDGTVINPFGNGSSMHAVTKFKETLLPSEVVAKNTENAADSTTAAQQ